MAAEVARVAVAVWHGRGDGGGLVGPGGVEEGSSRYLPPRIFNTRAGSVSAAKGYLGACRTRPRAKDGQQRVGGFATEGRTAQTAARLM